MSPNIKSQVSPKKGRRRRALLFVCKRILTILPLCAILSSFAQAPVSYLVVFTDKPNYLHTNPASFLSPRAIEHRQRYAIDITMEDYPIENAYIESVLKADTSIYLLAQSKWMNYIVVSCDTHALTKLRRLEFVKRLSALDEVDYTDLVQGRHFEEIRPDYSIPRQANPESIPIDTAYYGLMYDQLKVHNGQRLHQAGYKGEGMLIALLDCGFEGVDTFPLFDKLHEENRLLDSRDFVKEVPSIYTGNNHGMYVLSILAGNAPYKAVGTAPEAMYVLIKTEAFSYEEILEEYFLVAGLEYADSIGADVISISLGYTVFDSAFANHALADLDGLHSAASIAASIAVEKGILVSNSAGNEGDKAWKHISIPSDACNVLCVAAVNVKGEIAPFSSRGHESFTKIKPSIASVGWGTYVQTSDGSIEQGSGTSFSCPVNAGLAACLRQAFPQKTSKEILRAILQSCEHPNAPDSLSGYGIPDYWTAYRILEAAAATDKKKTVELFPNPVRSLLLIRAFYPHLIDRVEVTDAYGRGILTIFCLGNDRVEINMAPYASGIYFLQIYTETEMTTLKVLKE
jgi:hypothetical protein